MRMLTSCLVAIASLASACVTVEHGTVTKKLGGHQARVELGTKDQLAVGDRVALFESDCDETPAGSRAPDGIERCSDFKIGEGTVAKVEGPHTSVITVDKGVHYGFGTIVKAEKGKAH